MPPSPPSVRRIGLLAAFVAPLVVVSSFATPAAHGSQRAAAPLTVSFVDATGAPGTLLRLPRNRLVVRRTAAGRLAVGGKQLTRARPRTGADPRARPHRPCRRSADRPRGTPPGDTAEEPGRRALRRAGWGAHRRVATRPLPAARTGGWPGRRRARHAGAGRSVPPVSDGDRHAGSDGYAGPDPESSRPRRRRRSDADADPDADSDSDADCRRRYRRRLRHRCSPPQASGGHRCPRPRRWIRRVSRSLASSRRPSHRTSPTARDRGSRPPGPARRSTSSAPPNPGSASRSTAPEHGRLRCRRPSTSCPSRTTPCPLPGPTGT